MFSSDGRVSLTHMETRRFSKFSWRRFFSVLHQMDGDSHFLRCSHTIVSSSSSVHLLHPSFLHLLRLDLSPSLPQDGRTQLFFHPSLECFKDSCQHLQENSEKADPPTGHQVAVESLAVLDLLTSLLLRVLHQVKSLIYGNLPCLFTRSVYSPVTASRYKSAPSQSDGNMNIMRARRRLDFKHLSQSITEL